MDFILNGNVVSIDNEELTKALESDAKELTITTDLKIRTQEQEDSWLSKVKSGTIDTAMEMKLKSLKKARGLEFEGKTFEAMFDAFEAENKVKYTKDPNAQLESKDKDLTILKNALEVANLTNEGLVSDHKSFRQGIKADSFFESLVPENSILSKKQMAKTLKGEIAYGFDESGEMYFKDSKGDPIKDVNLDYVKGSKVTESFFTSNPEYLKGAAGGGGGGDSTPKTGSSREVFDKQQSDLGNNPGSLDYQDALIKHNKDNADQ